MDLIEIDVVGAEAAQGVIDLGHDCLAAQAFSVGSRAHRMTQFGRDDDIVALGEVAQGAAEDLLARALRIHVGGIEEIDATVDGVLDQRTRLVFAERPHRVTAAGITVGHRADRNGRHVQTGRAGLDVLHGYPIIWRYRRALRFSASYRTGEFSASARWEDHGRPDACPPSAF